MSATRSEPRLKASTPRSTSNPTTHPITCKETEGSVAAGSINQEDLNAENNQSRYGPRNRADVRTVIQIRGSIGAASTRSSVPRSASLRIRLRDLYATNDTYVLCRPHKRREPDSVRTPAHGGVPSEHYGHFIRASQADALELAKIDSEGIKIWSFSYDCPRRGNRQEKPSNYSRKLVEQKGFEPSTPTLRTLCSPS